MHKICREIGDDITYESTLKGVCKRLFGGRFAGVHPRDKMESILGKFEKGKEKPKTIEKTKYYIFNLDTRAEGGSHWCACVIQDTLVHIYDSFGRDIHLGVNTKNSDLNDKEQKIQEMNCGQRCIAWLLVCHKHGLNDAMLI